MAAASRFIGWRGWRWVWGFLFRLRRMPERETVCGPSEASSVSVNVPLAAPAAATSSGGGRSGTPTRLLTVDKNHGPQRRGSVLLACYCPAVFSPGYVLLELASISATCPNGEVADGGEMTTKMRSQVPAVKLQPAGMTPVPVESIA